MKIVDTITVDAPVADVWDHTIDVESWPDTVETMTSVQRLTPGPLGVGSTVRIEQPRQRPRIWTVTRLDPPRRFAWATRLAGTTMTATHRLESDGAGTRTTLEVELDGLLSPIVGAFLRRPIRRALAIENRGLKAASEHRHD